MQRSASALADTMLEATAFGVICADADGVITNFNAGAERLLGYARNEVIGRNLLPQFHLPRELAARAAELSVQCGREVPPGFEAIVARAAAGEIDEREGTYIRRDGSRLPVLLTIRRQVAPSEIAAGYVIIFQDISDKKRAEVAQQNDDNRLHRVLNHADCLVWEATVRLVGGDWDWRMTVHPSRFSRRLFGRHDPSSTAGLWYLFEVPDQAEMNRRCREALDHGLPGYTQEFRLIQDGNVLWIRETVSIEPNAPGEYWLVGVATDITTEKRAEASRNELVARLEKIGTQVPGLIYQFRRKPDGAVSFPYASPGLRTLFGVDPAEVATDGRKIFDLVHADDVARLAESIDKSAHEMSPWQCEFRSRRADGTVRWFFGNSVPERETDGSILWHGFVTDITERKAVDAKLAHALQEAVEASRFKSEFLATMSHEIRTPMNGVIGMTKLLSETELTDVQRDYVRTIESSGESLLTIVNDILDYSKIEAGRTEIESQPLDLIHCVEDALDLFASAVAEKQIDLFYHLDPDVPEFVMGDVTRVRQILVNLVGNAVKFTPTGEIGVTVAVVALGERLRLDFAVRDTGIGIPPEGLGRLFKSFSQVDASTTRRYGGSGLGLVIAQRLTELMGGQMSVESEPGRGSTFHFSIMANRVPGRERSLARRWPDLAGKRAVFVEGNAAFRTALCALAARVGLELTAVASADEAVDLLRDTRRCDALLVSVGGTGTRATALATSVHALPGRERLPCMALVPAGRRVSLQNFEAGVSKPLRADTLFAALCASRERGAPAIRPAGTTEAASLNFASRHPLRILVAEDNPVNQKVVRLLLQRLGYDPTMVTNGDEAIAALNLGDHDVILMDVEMPETDGREATRRIRADRGHPARPWIVALTASAMERDREQALAAGMNDYLTKPLRADTLTTALERAHRQIASAG